MPKIRYREIMLYLCFIKKESRPVSAMMKNMNLVGTMTKARRELPPSVVSHRGELFSTKLQRLEQSTLTVYQGKPRQSVTLLSTMHQAVAIGSDRKRKPETVTFYNTTTVRYVMVLS